MGPQRKGNKIVSDKKYYVYRVKSMIKQNDLEKNIVQFHSGVGMIS